MNELRAIVDAAARARSAGSPAILATVVRVRGSSYRKPGARMLLTEEGWQAGSVSGGCLEADILRRAWWRTRSGAPTLVTYDSTVSDDIDLDEEFAHGFGLGCNGIVDILLERLEPNDTGGPAAFLAECLRNRRSGVVATIIDTDVAGVAVGQRVQINDLDEATTALPPCLAEPMTALCRESYGRGVSQNARIDTPDGRHAEVFVEVIRPPMPLLVCGAGHDAIPLVRMAAELGWAVTVVDPRPGAAPRADRFPEAEAVLSCAPADLPGTVPIDSRTGAVVMSHNTALDTALLAALLPSPARYIGILGPRQRTERLLEALAVDGALPGLDRLFGPVGIDIGADTPEAIALSILAEIQAFTRGRDGGHLRAAAVAPSTVPRPNPTPSAASVTAIPPQEFTGCPLSPLPTPAAA